MPKRSKNLHGNASAASSVVLLLIDLITDFDFENGEEILKNAQLIVNNIAELKKKAKKAKVPVVYVNNNFGKWQSDFKHLLAHCLQTTSKGREIVRLLKPGKDDYFVLKPQNSGFYSTTLELLLEYLKAETLILAGLTTDICILFTANDAYMRDYKLLIPRDCVAAQNHLENQQALDYLERVLSADTKISTDIDFRELKKSALKK